MRTQSSSVRTLAVESERSEQTGTRTPQIIGLGSTVTIRDVQSGERDVYTLVPPDQADISSGRISTITPAGRALYGRSAGETVEIHAPGGIVRVVIENVRAPADE